MSRWIWDEPLPGTKLFPHHRRWDARFAIVGALRNLDDASTALALLARADAFIAVMFDCHDPMASAYAWRTSKIRDVLMNQGGVK